MRGPGSLVVAVAMAITHAHAQQKSQDYWWLGLPSPFGGRNYNLEEIQRGEHISNSSRFSRVGGGQRSFRGRRQRDKRQVGAESDLLDDIFSDQIDINEIETECPRLSQCVPRFFCERFRGRTRIDQIPCLLTSGEFSGQFGICCQDTFPRECPAVPRPPPPVHCRPRPLGQPEDHECSVPGSRDNCPGGEEALCCFNGCLNVCLTEPPYTVQRAYFDREKGIIVSDAGGPSSTGGDGGEGDGDYEDEDFFSGAINPRTGSPSSPTEARARELRALSASLSPRLSQLLLRLLDRLQDS